MVVLHNINGMIHIAFGILKNKIKIKMEVDKFENGKIRVKDEVDIDISHSKWNFIFNSTYFKNFAIYFIGWRLDFIYEIEIKKNLDNLINELAVQVFIDSEDHSKLLFKVNSLDRKVLKKLWQFYEYPSIFFLEDTFDEIKLVNAFNNNSRNILTQNGFCHLYKIDPETDTLWIEKSFDVIFFDL